MSGDKVAFMTGLDWVSKSPAASGCDRTLFTNTSLKLTNIISQFFWDGPNKICASNLKSKLTNALHGILTGRIVNSLHLQFHLKICRFGYIERPKICAVYLSFTNQKNISWLVLSPSSVQRWRHWDIKGCRVTGQNRGRDLAVHGTYEIPLQNTLVISGEWWSIN